MPPSPAFPPPAARQSASSRDSDRFKAELSLAMKSFFFSNVSQCWGKRQTDLRPFRVPPVGVRDVDPRPGHSATFRPVAAQFAQINSHFRRYGDLLRRGRAES